MTNKDLDIDTGPYGNRLTLRTRWSERVRDVIYDRRVVHLDLTNPRDYPSSDLRFLCEFPFLRALSLVCGEADIGPIECLDELRSLVLNNHHKNRLDFKSFPHLESLSVSWNPSVKGLIQLRKLSKLVIEHPPKTVIPHIGEMTELEELALFTCSAEDLSPLGNLRKLRALRLSMFRMNTGNAFVSKLTGLEKYHIQDSRGFTSFEPLRNLRKLKMISISESGPYESLVPLRYHRNLEHVHIGGPVLDGDYSPVEDMPQLQRYYRRWR